MEDWLLGGRLASALATTALIHHGRMSGDYLADVITVLKDPDVDAAVLAMANAWLAQIAVAAMMRAEEDDAELVAAKIQEMALTIFSAAHADNDDAATG